MNAPSPTWVNWSGTQRFRPKAVLRPHSLFELQQIVREASVPGRRLKAVATGLSFSDILRTDDTLVEVVDLRGEAELGALLPLEDELFKQPRPATPLVRVPAGARIRALNEALEQAGLGFTNLGGYDGQTLIGAISTSTHGSGFKIPPLCDGVRSLDLVTTDGELFRIEPSTGLTEPDAFARRYGKTRTLLQSDAFFYPCLVNLGCMGVIHSLIVAVSPSYRLLERRRMRRWSDVRQELGTLGPLLKFRNYEVTINPYRKRDGDYDCLVTEREVARPQVEPQPLPPDRRSAESLTFLATTQRSLLNLMNEKPRLIPGILNAGLEALETRERDHIDASYRVYNVGEINTVQVASGEYFFPIKDGVYLAAIEGLCEVVRTNARRGIYQPTPLSLRFMAGSRAPLSMARDEPHASIEIALFTGSNGAAEALLSYERLCLKWGGRPHWGQMHECTGERGWLRKAYPNLDGWLRAFDLFNRKGTFNNHFTDRLGLSLPRGDAP